MNVAVIGIGRIGLPVAGTLLVGVTSVHPS